MFGRSLVFGGQARLLEERARAVRFSPTRSEERLWRSLSGSKLGFAFRRQLAIGPYIVDFACTKVRLVVEVDGPYHEERARPTHGAMPCFASSDGARWRKVTSDR